LWRGPVIAREESVSSDQPVVLSGKITRFELVAS
jgi:hypothetical protein